MCRALQLQQGPPAPLTRGAPALHRALVTTALARATKHMARIAGVLSLVYAELEAHCHALGLPATLDVLGCVVLLPGGQGAGEVQLRPFVPLPVPHAGTAGELVLEYYQLAGPKEGLRRLVSTRPRTTGARAAGK